jgi:hypothetical protein
MMSNRELLQEAACALQNFLNSGFPDEWDGAVRQASQGLIDRLEAEADKQDAIEGGDFEISGKAIIGLLDAAKKLPTGKYRLLAVRRQNGATA